MIDGPLPGELCEVRVEYNAIGDVIYYARLLQIDVDIDGSKRFALQTDFLVDPKDPTNLIHADTTLVISDPDRIQSLYTTQAIL